MRSFEQRKAEVLMRSAKAIEMKRVKTKACLLLCSVILMSAVTFAGINSISSSKMITDNGSGNSNVLGGPTYGGPNDSEGDSVDVSVGLEGAIGTTVPEANIPDLSIPNVEISYSASDTGSENLTQMGESKAQNMYDLLIQIVSENRTEKIDGVINDVVIKVTVNGEVSVYRFRNIYIEHEGKVYLLTKEQIDLMNTLLGTQSDE
jgi:hypothetical protein